MGWVVREVMGDSSSKMMGFTSTWKYFTKTCITVVFDTRTAEMSSRLMCDADLEWKLGGFATHSGHVH